MLALGDTQKTRAELETYLRSINHQYTQATYDLINHNCNNFSNTVAMFLLGTGIPTHIADLPRIVFSTPGGMMLRPMIESMQSGISAQSGGGGLDPFGAAGGGSGGAGHPLATLSSISSTDYSGSTATTTATTVAPLPSSSSPSMPPAQVVTTTTLRTFTPTPEEKPFVSADIEPNTLKVLCNKILNYNNTNSNSNNVSEVNEKQVTAVLSAEDRTELSITVEALGTATLLSFPSRTFVALAHLAHTVPPLQMASLFLLRLLALHLHKSSASACSRGTPAYTACQLGVWELLSMVQATSSGSNSFSSPSSLVMALCTLANLLSSPAGCDLLFRHASIANSESEGREGGGGEGGEGESDSESAAEAAARVSACVDVCAWGLSHSKPEVRQMSATLAYNLALASTRAGVGGVTQSILITQDVTLPWRNLHGHQEELEKAEGVGEEEDEDLHQHIVQLLCATLESVAEETDAVSLGRKLHAAYFVCVAGGSAAVDLVAALGFDELLQQVRARDRKQQHRALLTHMDRSRLGNFELLLYGP